MKLSIRSNEKLEKFYLRNLDKETVAITLDKEALIPYGWYELIVPYTGKKIEISDILNNNESIKELIYTGYYTDGNGAIHQPATAVWDKGGYFTIWIHTQTGILWQRFCDQIRSGDFGTNLFDKYMLTVDRNVKIKNNFTSTLQSYFANGYGPNWWLKNDKLTPYTIVDSNDVKATDTEKLLSELDKCLPYKHKDLNGVTGWHRAGLKEGCADLPFVEVNHLGSEFVQNFVNKLGYKRIIDIAIQKLAPNTAVPIHRDDHYRRKGYPYTSGAKKFYWNLSSANNVFFKLGTAGLLPLDQPLFINTVEHVHAVINQSEEERTVIHMYGEL